jgi:hypothetical protein
MGAAGIGLGKVTRSGVPTEGGAGIGHGEGGCGNGEGCGFGQGGT